MVPYVEVRQDFSQEDGALLDAEVLLIRVGLWPGPLRQLQVPGMRT